jgi:mycofactocin precursor
MERPPQPLVTLRDGREKEPTMATRNPDPTNPVTTELEEPVVTADALVEEVSIDGMCGMY